VFCGRNFGQLATLTGYATLHMASNWLVAVLPTSGNLIRPNQPKNSAADEKILPLTSFKKAILL
jgi:hypothetical protein